MERKKKYVGKMMRGREEKFGVMPREFENAGDQQEQREEESRALAHHQGNMFVTAREKREERGENGGVQGEVS